MRRFSWRLPTTLASKAVQRRWLSDARPFRPGDLVLLQRKQDRAAPPILTKPLEPGKRIETHRGHILHDDIIGKRVRGVVKSLTPRSGKDGTEYRIHQVTLDDYVRLSRRLVTPIYPADANLIVNLLDLHPDEDVHNDGEERLEILEAGTGHGALTLHLSRAVHAANSSIRLKHNDGTDIENAKAQRKAVIHTIDVSPAFSAHAEKIIEGFRNGMYSKNVDFHVGDVSETLERLRAARPNAEDEPFLSHAFLDLPSAEKHLSNVAAALRTDGTLIVFNPSITQINECAEKVRDERIGLVLEKVVELGVNGGSGGREWDVRFVRPRSTQKKPAVPDAESDFVSDSAESLESQSDTNSESALRVPEPDAEQKWSMVCRPKVGERIIGGGFLGVWKKHRDPTTYDAPSSEASEST